MTLKSTYDMQKAERAKQFAATLEQLAKDSDKQIQDAKEKIQVNLGSGLKSFTVILNSIEIVNDDDNQNLSLLINQRLEHAIANWLDEEGFAAVVIWKHPRIWITICDQYNVLRLNAKAPISVKDLASKFEKL